MLPLEKALFGVPRTDRDTLIVARHYGFDGKGGANFQRIGNEFGLTRERVRQIVCDAEPRRHFLPKGLSVLEKAVAAIAASLPAAASEVEAKLQRAGLTAKLFRVEGIVSAAGLLDRPVPFRITSLEKTRFLVPSAYPHFRELVGQARQQVRRHGMATIAEFVQNNSAESAEREQQVITAVMASEADFRWLDRRSGWFWLAETPRNCAVSRIRKMLAVANPLPVSELRAGLGRMGSTTLAPEATLLAFCRQLSGLSVRGDFVHADPQIQTTDVLNRTELDIYQLLSENNGLMSNSDLICQSHILGMKRPTFYQCVTYSPIVTRYKGNHYRLIGSAVQSDAASA